MRSAEEEMEDTWLFLEQFGGAALLDQVRRTAPELVPPSQRSRSGPADAGPADAGPADAGDAGPADAGDAGPADAEPLLARKRKRTTLSDMPPELLAYIQQFLGARDSASLRNTSRYTRFNLRRPRAIDMFVDILATPAPVLRRENEASFLARKLIPHVNEWARTATVKDIVDKFVPLLTGQWAYKLRNYMRGFLSERLKEGGFGSRLNEIVPYNTSGDALITRLQSVSNAEQLRQTLVIVLLRDWLSMYDLETNPPFYETDAYFILLRSTQARDETTMEALWGLVGASLIADDLMRAGRPMIWREALSTPGMTVAGLDALDKLYPFNRSMYRMTKPLHHNARRWHAWIDSHKTNLAPSMSQAMVRKVKEMYGYMSYRDVKRIDNSFRVALVHNNRRYIDSADLDVDDVDDDDDTDCEDGDCEDDFPFPEPYPPFPDEGVE